MTISRISAPPTMEKNTLRAMAVKIALVVAIAFTSNLVACSPGKRIAQSQPISHTARVGSTEFNDAVAHAVNEPWTDGNHITHLVNGDAFFPAMLESINSAKKSITFETYAFVNGTSAYEFVTAFCKKSTQGVKVHVILDSVGSIEIGAGNIQRLRRNGVELILYNSLSQAPLKYNIRDHRKLMVVDGSVGYIGGSGVADAWKGNAETPKHWRENHYRVTGPVVAQIQRAFLDNWEQSGGSPLTGNAYFPPLHPTGSHKAQVFISSPEDKRNTIPHLYRQALASAQKSIIIETPYFLPDPPLINEILAARKRGVHVELIFPGHNTDARLVRALTKTHYQKLLKAGVHIYEYQHTMMHCKVLITDDKFSSIGSANFDPRSLYINDESNMNIIGSSFAKKQRLQIDRDKKQCIRIMKAPSKWNPFTLPQRICAKILEPQL